MLADQPAPSQANGATTPEAQIAQAVTTANESSVLARQGVVKFRPECPPRELVEQLLDAAVQAPNHHLSQPWRFCVMTGKAREDLGEVLAGRLREKIAAGRASAPSPESALDTERKKPLRAPVVIMVARRGTDHPKAMQVEDLASVAAAAQNIILAAPAVGLGAYWRTGDAAYDPVVKEHFGLKPDDDIVGFLYVGYAESTRPTLARARGTEKAEWRGWDDTPTAAR